MRKSVVTIRHEAGLHTRPASIFVREAARFQCEVTLACDDVSVNGKSIMGLLMLALSPGSLVTLVVDGPDEEAALESLAGVLSGDFE